MANDQPFDHQLLGDPYVQLQGECGTCHTALRYYLGIDRIQCPKCQPRKARQLAESDLAPLMVHA